MYKIMEMEEEVRVPADMMGLGLEEAIERAIEKQYEGTINEDLGVVLAVEEVEETGDGRMVPGKGAVYYPAKFRLLTYVPREHEVVLGEVIDITDFGAFLRIGPLDGLVHISQVMDDYVSYDEKNGVLAGKETNKVLKDGDLVRARVISISFSEETKIGLTMRQPGLGALHWMQEGASARGRQEEEPAEVSEEEPEEAPEEEEDVPEEEEEPEPEEEEEAEIEEETEEQEEEAGEESDEEEPEEDREEQEEQEDTKESDEEG